MSDIVSQAVDVSVRAAPPVVVTGLSVYGVTLPDIVSGLTIVYLIIQISYVSWKWFKGR
ncbi:holin [Vibrio phage D530]